MSLGKLTFSEAQQRLIESYSDANVQEKLRRFGRSCTRKDQDVSDLIQQAYLNAWKASAEASFKGNSAIETWLRSIMHNQLHGERVSSHVGHDGERKMKSAYAVRKLSEGSEGDASLHKLAKIASDVRPEEAVYAEQVVKTIDRLPPEKRNVLMGRADGRSCEEMAEEYGVPEATIRTRLFHARKALAELVS